MALLSCLVKLISNFRGVIPAGALGLGGESLGPFTAADGVIDGA
jgi:hypothetical protein